MLPEDFTSIPESTTPVVAIRVKEISGLLANLEQELVTTIEQARERGTTEVFKNVDGTFTVILTSVDGLQRAEDIFDDCTRSVRVLSLRISNLTERVTVVDRLYGVSSAWKEAAKRVAEIKVRIGRLTRRVERRSEQP